MKLAITAIAFAPLFALAGPVAAQTANGGFISNPSVQPQPYFRTGQFEFPGRYDDKSTRIDRRTSARFQAAKMARKARERAEREARQPDRG